MNIVQSPSPNFYGRFGYVPELLVVHCTDGFWPSDKEWLRNPAAQVSSHFVISPAGEVHQLVSTDNGAWHGGRVDHPVATLKKKPDGTYVNPNYYSIGIEVSLKPPAHMPTAQKNALLELLREMGTKYNIPLDRAHIVGHKEIYSLKTCPGTIDVNDVVAALGQAPVPTPPPGNNNAALKNQIIDLVNKIV
jgi:N-acetyl-anhydromuramyl-L-alanine amidase AmpD